MCSIFQSEQKQIPTYMLMYVTVMHIILKHKNLSFAYSGVWNMSRTEV